jgi:hypothetical protein
MGFFFEEIFHFAKMTEFSRKGGWRTVMMHAGHDVCSAQKDTYLEAHLHRMRYYVFMYKV